MKLFRIDRSLEMTDDYRLAIFRHQTPRRVHRLLFFGLTLWTWYPAP